jgi:predicted amidophosphoribosyltransferase
VDRCRDCPPATIASARAAFAYRGPAREAVHRLKFSGWRGVGEALAGALVTLGPPAADAVTWVPLAPRRRAERGFDQAQVLARALARQLDLPSSAFVRRRSAAGTQARRARDERFAAMAGAFVPLGRGGPSPPTLLLVDDVLTTGATAAACAAALADAGAHTVHLLTACRSFSDHSPRPRGSRRPDPVAYTRDRAPVRVCGCPGNHPGSRCQPRAKRPT